MQWLKEEFLGYLDKWEAYTVKKQPTMGAEDRQKMMISAETVAGLKITGTGLQPCILVITAATILQ